MPGKTSPQNETLLCNHSHYLIKECLLVPGAALRVNRGHKIQTWLLGCKWPLGFQLDYLWDDHSGQIILGNRIDQFQVALKRLLSDHSLFILEQFIEESERLQSKEQSQVSKDSGKSEYHLIEVALFNVVF